MILDLHENYPYAVTTYNWTKGFLRNLISQPQKWKKKEMELLSYPQKIIVLSDEFRDHLVNEYKFLLSEHFCVLPNVPDIKQMENFGIRKKEVAYVKKAPVILYFGVVAERRGIFNAINAFSEAISKGYDAEFMIIGPVDKKDRKMFYESTSYSGIKQKIKYIPWINISELPTYLDLSDICLAPFIKNPQHESGVANKIYDYMAGRRPIIASDCLPQQKLIEKYECGIIYTNQEEFTNSIIKLLSDEKMRKRMGENGFNAVVSEFNIDKKKLNLLNTYMSLLIH
jgi:glycosyltransferase involved in cell wall biosynthesis